MPAQTETASAVQKKNQLILDAKKKAADLAANTPAADVQSYIQQGDAAKEAFSKTGVIPPASVPTPATTPPTPAAIPPPTQTNVFESDAYKKAAGMVGGDSAERKALIDEIVAATKAQGASKASALERLYGSDSRLATFFQPQQRAIDEQIVAANEALGNLRKDITATTQGTEITAPQARMLEATKREPLADTLNKLTQARAMLVDQAVAETGLAEKAAQAALEQGQSEIDALSFKLQNSGVSPQEAALISQALSAQLNQENALFQDTLLQKQEERLSEKEKEAGLQKAISEVTDIILASGITPSANFQRVIQDANVMLQEGRSLSEIKNAMLQAVGQNPAVQKYLQMSFAANFKKASGNGVSAPAFDAAGLVNLYNSGSIDKDMMTNLTKLLPSKEKSIVVNELVKSEQKQSDKGVLGTVQDYLTSLFGGGKFQSVNNLDFSNASDDISDSDLSSI